MVFVPDQAAVEKLVTARLHPPLHDRVHPRHPDAGEHGLDTGIRENLVHESGELAVTVSNQEPGPAACILQIHDEVPYLLGHPRPVG
ncbi:hypothetical protein ACIBKY_33420 [Nonomuraea sp. NPDC050394]|uniref:hypothetical protein n=1 Tax=Nonomuraea sp. NPDC050394 TaxID=3364363 RepID=UPI0037AC0B95